MTDTSSHGHADAFHAPPVSERESYAIVGGVMLAMLLAALDQTIVAPALPTMGETLGHAEYLPWVVTAYLLSSIATAPLYGKISDLYGRRRTLIGAVLVFLVGSVLCALAGSMFALVAGRFVQGLGGGGLFVLSMTVIGDLVPPRERGRFTAWISGTWAIASVAGPLLGGYFAAHLHWSLIFWINLPLGALALAIMNGPLRKLQTPYRPQRLDLPGAFLLVGATGLLLLALNWGGSVYPWASATILALGGAIVVLVALLAFRLLRTEEPLISVEILANPIVGAACAAAFLTQAAHLGLTVFIPLYLQQGLDVSVAASGTALLGFLLGTVSGAWASGRLLMRVERYRLLAVGGSAFSMTCLVVFGLTAGSVSLPVMELLTVGIGFGTGMTFPIATVSAQNAVARSDLGAATGLVTFLRALGGAIGVAVLGAVALANGLPMAREGARAAGGAVSAGSFSVIFLTAALSMLGTVTAYALMPEKPLQGRD